MQLPLEQQFEMIILKFQKMKLKEIKKHGKGISNKEYVEDKVNSIVKYFIERNKKEENKGNLTEEDIMYMIYKFPGMINYSIDEKIDKTINFLEKDADLGFTNTNHILKVFPSILGYSIERTNTQIKILKDNNLIDAIISTPMKFMQSPELMYALIEYAKERHKTSNLDGVNRSNIFMANATIKRLYKTNYDEIKKKYPMIENQLPISEIRLQTGNQQRKTDQKDKVKADINEQIKNIEKNKAEEK